jgi:ABC-2 type transport system permease protein
MEVVRISTVRSSHVLLVTAVVLGTLIVLLLGLLSPVGPMNGDNSSTALSLGGDVMPLSVVGLMIATLGVVTVSHDYRFGLVRAVLTAQPRRGALVSARLTVLAVIAAATASLDSALGGGLCVAFGRPPLLDATTVRVMLLHVGVVVAWAWLGAGLTWILRNAAGALAVLLLGPLIVEPVLWLAAQSAPLAALRAVVPWLPFSAARQSLGRNLASDGPALGALPAAVDVAVTTGLVVGIAWLIVQRRDA